MDPLTIGLGIAAAAYGIYTAYIRKVNPRKLGKLEAMKKTWGPKAGLIIHFTTYTIMPIVVGVALIISGTRGLSIIDVIKM